jgi:hypothetical protein
MITSSFKLDDKLWRSLKHKAIEEGITVSLALRTAVENYVGGKPAKVPEYTEDLVNHIKYWNSDISAELKAPVVQELTLARASSLRKRLEEHPNLWNDIVGEIKYLREDVLGSSWLTFDFFMGENNLAKWCDGNYRRKEFQRRVVDGGETISSNPEEPKPAPESEQGAVAQTPKNN